LILTVETCICSVCGRELPAEHFKTYTYRVVLLTGPREYTYRRRQCKDCYSAIAREGKRRWRARHPDLVKARARDYYLKFKASTTPEERRRYWRRKKLRLLLERHGYNAD
jgi:hypothetical protein